MEINSRDLRTLRSLYLLYNSTEIPVSSDVETPMQKILNSRNSKNPLHLLSPITTYLNAKTLRSYSIPNESLSIFRRRKPYLLVSQIPGRRIRYVR